MAWKKSRCYEFLKNHVSNTYKYTIFWRFLGCWVTSGRCRKFFTGLVDTFEVCKSFFMIIGTQRNLNWVRTWHTEKIAWQKLRSYEFSRKSIFRLARHVRIFNRLSLLELLSNFKCVKKIFYSTWRYDLSIQGLLQDQWNTVHFEVNVYDK